jgi:hypothetical protein
MSQEPKSDVPRTSGKAITSQALGIDAICVPIVFSIPGVIFGFAALDEVKRSHGRIGGRSIAITGIVLSVIGFILRVILVILLSGVRIMY